MRDREVMHMILTFKKSDDSITGVFSNFDLIFWYSTWRSTWGISPELNWFLSRWILQRRPSPESLRNLVSSKIDDMVKSYFILVLRLRLRVPWSHLRQVFQIFLQIFRKLLLRRGMQWGVVANFWNIRGYWCNLWCPLKYSYEGMQWCTTNIE